MSVNPGTIVHVIPKPGGREAILIRRVVDHAGPRLEITLARPMPDETFVGIRSVGIGKNILKAFCDGLPAAVDAVLSERPTDRPVVTETAPRRSRRHHPSDEDKRDSPSSLPSWITAPHA